MVVHMSLKRELLSIEPDQVRAAIAGIISKARDLSDEEYEHEYFFTDANYPVLSRIPLRLYDLLMKNELPGADEPRAAEDMMQGAQFMLRVLVELAEAQDLPPID